MKEANKLIYTGKFSESLELCRKIIKQSEAEKDSASLGFAILLSADCYYYLGQTESVLPALYRALEIYEALNDAEGIGRSYYNIAYSYERSDPARMVEVLKTARSYAEQTEADGLKMNIANAAGVALWGLGKYDKAIVAFEKSVSIAEKNDWGPSAAAALQNLALIHLNQGRPREALQYTKQALKIFKEEGATHSYAVGLGNNGNAYCDLGEFEKGLACYEESMAIHKENGYSQGVAINLNNIAHVYLILGEVDQARNYLEKAMVIHEKMEDKRDYLHSLSYLGKISLQESDDAGARSYYQRALEIGAILGDPYLLDWLEISMAGIEMNAGNDGLAEQWLDKAEIHATEAGKPATLGHVLAGRSELLERKGDLTGAAETLRLAIAEHDKIKLRSDSYHWHARLAQILSASGDQAGARRHFEASLDLIGHLDALIATDRFRVGLFQDVSLIYHQYAVWLARRGEVFEAMAMLDRGRSRVLAMRLLQNNDPGGFSPEQKAALNRISMLQRKLRAEVDSNEENEEFLRLLAEAEWDYEKATGTTDHAGDAGHIINFDDFDGSELYLSYSVQNDTLLVFSLSGGRADFRVSGNAESILKRARMYSDLMANPDSSPRSRVVGKKLCRILMGPELETFHGKHILLNPDLDLWTFPFVALITDEGNYLGEQFSLGMTPSWAVQQSLSERPSVTGNRALILANSDFDQEPASDHALIKLNSTELEAESIASHFENPTILINATESEFKATALDQYDLLHFATHTLTDIDHPLRSSIIMSMSDNDDGFLQAREIHHLPLNCSLAVVSGCKSGVGKVVLGEGLQGVTHAFLRAGSRCVVLSRWDITDEGGEHFMTEFYNALEDHSIVDALSLAQEKLRNSEKWSHPYYWASFYVAGEGSVSLDLAGGKGCPISGTNRAVIVIAALACLLGGVVLVWKRQGRSPSK